VKEFSVEIRIGEPKFFAFRFPKNFLFKKKLFKRGLEGGFNGERGRVGRGILDVVKFNQNRFDLGLTVTKVKVIPSPQRGFGMVKLFNQTVSKRARNGQFPSNIYHQPTGRVFGPKLFKSKGQVQE
jgi:hypothetical protein